MKLITILLTTITISLLLIGCGGGGGSGGSSSGGGTDNRSGDSGIVDGDGNGNNGDGNGGDNRSGDNGVIGDDNRSGDGGIIDGDGNGGELNIPAQAEWTIVPLAGGLSIQWHNLNNFTQMNAPQRLSINLTRSDTSAKQTHTIDISDFINGVYQLTGLEDGIAYKFASMIELEYGGNISHSRPISLLREFNRLDNAVNGIVVGANHDGDGRADGVDADDDNDGRPNNMDNCRLGEIGWNSDNTTLDYDSDGCRNDEDPDGDNDGILNEDEEAGCSLAVDCDGDSLMDDYPTEQLKNMDGVSCSVLGDCDNDNSIDTVDIDDDGDGLIEIGTAAELDAVRYVLDGTGFKANEGAVLNQTGCGDGVNVMVCNGYELVRDIPLTDYIAANYSMVGWKPIAPDMGTSSVECGGDSFTGTFDGNGFEVRGLFINRPNENCIGLFGRVSGTIQRLGVVADKVIGKNRVGGLVGQHLSSEIVQSYVVSNLVSGNNGVAGLVGFSTGTKIIQSYAVSDEVSGRSWNMGGLLGYGQLTLIVQSYSVNGVTRGAGLTGGLVGDIQRGEIVQSYTVNGEVGSGNHIGGLAGAGRTATNSYWDTETSGRTNSAVGSEQTSVALRMPTGYTDIYDTWDDGAMVNDINVNTTIWCDEDQSGVIEDDERLENNKVWDFGSATDYPALRCTGDSLTDQRAWWYLNTTSHKPQLNTTRLNAYLDGSLP